MLNTTFIERLNATFRQRLASLTCKSRHATSRLQGLHTDMYLIGSKYNFYKAHQEMSKAKHWGTARTPAMASGLAEHNWSLDELLGYKVAPSPWVEQKRRGRSLKQVGLHPKSIKRLSLRARFSDFGSSSQGELILDHLIMWLYHCTCIKQLDILE